MSEMLAQLSKLRQELAKATTLEEVQQITDKAEALRILAKRVGESLAIVNQITEDRLWAERRGGEMLRDGERQRRGRPKKMRQSASFSENEADCRILPKLSDIGLESTMARRWLKLADIPKTEYTRITREVMEANEEELSRAILLRWAEDQKHQQRRKDRKKKVTEAADKVLAGGRIIVGDFYQNADEIPDDSLSLIFTDPPYLENAIAMLPQLADFAARKLAPYGSILFYLGHIQLPGAFKAFEDKLRYWWTCACVHEGGNAVMLHYGIRVGWKPMLWFVKDGRFDTQTIVLDTVSGAREKEYHDWQQDEGEAAYWIDKLCPPDGVVCDPFLGGGTTAAAAIKLNRKWIGFEIDPETALIASSRLEGENDQTV